MEDDGAELTIEDLADRAGLAVSTVRLYHNRGLLPPPRRRGRVGWYGPRHRDRLRMIAHLQRKGFSLAAIREALNAWDDGRTLDHLVGANVLALAGLEPVPAAPLRMTVQDLLDRFEGTDLSDADIERAVALGLIVVDGDEVSVRDPALAELGPVIARLGVPVAELLDGYEVVAGAVGVVADRFREVFERRLWEPFVEAGSPGDGVVGLSGDAARLAALAGAVVANELRGRVAEITAGYLDRAGGVDR